MRLAAFYTSPGEATVDARVAYTLKPFTLEDLISSKPAPLGGLVTNMVDIHEFFCNAFVGDLHYKMKFIGIVFIVNVFNYFKECDVC